MRKALVLTAILLFVATSAFAQFSPSPMTLSGPSTVVYDFDGTDLSIPVTVAGAPAKVILCVFTKDMGATIGLVNNGMLGWHYVNNIDTCVYFSAGSDLAEGNGAIVWDGTDQDGATVAAGEYYYYLYGYDASSFRVPVFQSSKWITDSWSDTKYVNQRFIERDFEGTLYPKPILYLDCGIGRRTGPDDLYGGAEHDDLFGYNGTTGMNTRGRWYVGNEPLDDTLVESTTYVGIGAEHSIVPDPYEAEKFITRATDSDLVVMVRRFEWITGGEAVQDISWGDGGVYQFASLAVDGWDATLGGMEYAGEDRLVLANASHYGAVTETELVVVDATDGTELTKFDMAEWWVDVEDAVAGGQSSGGPNQTGERDGRMVLGSHGSCMYMAVNPSAGDDKEDWLVWANGNGDYVGDRNYEEDSAKAWVCIDYAAKPNTYSVKQDGQFFTTVSINGLGVDSFALFAPDGTGIGHFAYSGDADGPHHMNDFIDTGGAYDGNYLDNVGIIKQNDPIDAASEGIWYLAQDSFKGVISNEAGGVDAAAPGAFAVAQNSPNPFNPTTTINFTLVEAGNVTVDVFNVAGQKVDTLVNDFMTPGNQSVVWDASNFSAGVYFYTVNAGDFSKTMKMTLVK